MKRRLFILSALLLVAGPPAGQAALLQVQTISRSSPGTPVPVIGSILQPLNILSNPTLAAPSLVSIWSAMPFAPAPRVLAAPAPALTQTAAIETQALPIQAGLAAAAQTISEAKQQPETPVETLAVQAAHTFDGAKPAVSDAVSVPEAPAAAPVASKPLRLIITGPPGSGKGTYSEKIAAEYGVVHISVGELLRSYAATHPEVAKVMATGKLVDSKLVLDVVRQRLSQSDIKERGFILDGFPRRSEEAAALQEMLGDAGVDGVIELKVPEGELLRRILARGRADDKADVFKERMKIYREQTVPAVERFKSGAPVLAPEVSGSSIEANYARVKAALGGLLDKLLGN
ncbi:MAG: nucleoside monophosphate kinase [Elusimicrobia bacterium]|nr:nucleoside monophosphate kinase [Elusimicrobiota bacterium]